MARSKPVLMTISAQALQRIQSLIAQRPVLEGQLPCLGVRIILKTKGCAALAYGMEFVTEPIESDEKIPLGERGLSLFIQSKAVMFLVGTEMDYQDTVVRSGFVFRNPQEKGRCGCGSSFYV